MLHILSFNFNKLHQMKHFGWRRRWWHAFLLLASALYNVTQCQQWSLWPLVGDFATICKLNSFAYMWINIVFVFLEFSCNVISLQRGIKHPISYLPYPTKVTWNDITYLKIFKHVCSTSGQTWYLPMNWKCVPLS